MLHKCQAAEFKLSDVLPTGEIEIEFMDVQMSARGTELSEKFQAAAAANKDWLLDYIKEVSKPGQPLPYHANLGLSKIEYEEFLLASENMKIEPTGIRWKCNFTVENNIFTITPLGHRSASLRSIRLDLQSEEATASGVTLGKPRWRTGKGDDSAIGPWKGYLWSTSKGKITDGKEFLIAEFDVVHRLDSDKMLVRHKHQYGTNRQNERSVEFMFQFSAPTLRSHQKSGNRLPEHANRAR